jgi:hypothetical protein
VVIIDSSPVDCYSAILHDGVLSELHYLSEYHPQLCSYADYVRQSQGLFSHHDQPFPIFTFTMFIPSLESLRRRLTSGNGYKQDLGTVLLGWTWFGGLPFDWVRLDAFLPLMAHCKFSLLLHLCFDGSFLQVHGLQKYCLLLNLKIQGKNKCSCSVPKCSLIIVGDM